MNQLETIGRLAEECPGGLMESVVVHNDDSQEKQLWILLAPRTDNLGVGMPERYLYRVIRWSWLWEAGVGLEIPGKSLNMPFGPHVSGKGVFSCINSAPLRTAIRNSWRLSERVVALIGSGVKVFSKYCGRSAMVNVLYSYRLTRYLLRYGVIWRKEAQLCRSENLPVWPGLPTLRTPYCFFHHTTHIPWTAQLAPKQILASSPPVTLVAFSARWNYSGTKHWRPIKFTEAQLHNPSTITKHAYYSGVF